MRILILGSKGMLGQALQRACSPDTVVGWDREELDITDASAVAERLPGAEPDVVVNAAAYTDVEGAEREPEVADRVNGHAVGVLAEVCSRYDLPLVHVSTDYVFGNERKAGYRETDEPRAPGSTYGRSKLIGEVFLRKRAQKYWLVRTAWLFGPHGKHFVDTMLRIGSEKREVHVVKDQHGSPTYTRDLAHAIYTLVADGAPFGMYHLTNSGVTTRAEFARAIFADAGMDVRVTPITSEECQNRAKRPKWSTLKNTKRPPLRPWRVALQEYLRTVVPPSQYEKR